MSSTSQEIADYFSAPAPTPALTIDATEPPKKKSTKSGKKKHKQRTAAVEQQDEPLSAWTAPASPQRRPSLESDEGIDGSLIAAAAEELNAAADSVRPLSTAAISAATADAEYSSKVEALRADRLAYDSSEQQRRLDEILEYEEAERMRRSHAERWHVMQMLEWKRMMVSQMEQGRPITSPNLLMGGVTPSYHPPPPPPQQHPPPSWFGLPQPSPEHQQLFMLQQPPMRPVPHRAVPSLQEILGEDAYAHPHHHRTQTASRTMASKRPGTAFSRKTGRTTGAGGREFRGSQVIRPAPTMAKKRTFRADTGKLVERFEPAALPAPNYSPPPPPPPATAAAEPEEILKAMRKPPPPPPVTPSNDSPAGESTASLLAEAAATLSPTPTQAHRFSAGSGKHVLVDPTTRLSPDIARSSSTSKIISDRVQKDMKASASEADLSRSQDFHLFASDVATAARQRTSGVSSASSRRSFGGQPRDSDTLAQEALNSLRKRLGLCQIAAPRKATPEEVRYHVERSLTAHAKAAGPKKIYHSPSRCSCSYGASTGAGRVPAWNWSAGVAGGPEPPGGLGTFAREK